MTDDRLANLRREYSKSKLSRSSVSPDPIEQFGKWMDEALGSQLPEPAAMILSTVSAEGRPSSRVVLCKGFNGDGFVFFSNYRSRKGRDLENNPFAALHFFWPELERQINISGSVSKVSAEESDEYFASRPFASRIGAWASHQSEALRSRTELVKRAAALTLKYPTGNVPRPPHWGGYRLAPDRIEFWQGRESRLHDRICYTREGGQWTIERLSP